ncbi:hypothetical protein [Tenacibaculum maritimum]|uniref:Uncharacterized protein n=1 Tax=Tenacibaculum maritimum NCIMB 2154 TaxID=1349785 RepID=A0A2H1E6P0_9FLAO|nr:hypothetical protein [Tenacibaculum maritimum]MCD9581983.1 hypothetical protein [Tenacibaculum maritimum]MCD9584990.1 hypothetical protein [Tenacibaculum maritimum]MCD9620438.1 hypothetical protein [Tenacibaculum maritimum]MCD9626639.1 hypothetical protein [Tenacibaculum maritimum]MCD9629036.1 hypothetical protein [Tenacibaculum maritimum]
MGKKRLCKVCSTDISHKKRGAKYCAAYCRQKDVITRQRENIKFEDTYTQKYNFALSLGFNSVTDALGGIGKNEFNKKFKKTQDMGLKKKSTIHN